MRTFFTSFFAFLILFGSAQNSMNVELLYNWNDSTLPATIFHNNRYNDVWGYAKNGEEYAIIGSTMGVHFFDVSDVQTVELVDFVPGEVQGNQQVHRDYHEYNGYLYTVCDEGPSTLQIIDLSYLPDSVHKVYDSGALFTRSHNIFIDTTSAKMYVCGGNLTFSVFSLADPISPVLLSHAPIDIPWWNSTVGYVHDVYVRNDTAYCNAEGRGLFVVDFTDTSLPVLLGSLTSYPQSGYNHSGWLSDDGYTYAMVDENHGKDIKLLDVTDITDIQVIDTISTEVHALSIPHNLIFKGPHLYTSYYHDGFYMWNTSDPSNAIITGFYDTSTEPHAPNYRGAWGVYPFLPSGIVLVSDMQNGLFVFNVENAVGVNDAPEIEGFRVWPVPFEGRINIQGLLGQTGIYSLELIDALGRSVMQQEIHLDPFSVQTVNIPSGIGPGSYFLVLNNGTSRNVKHLIKTH